MNVGIDCAIFMDGDVCKTKIIKDGVVVKVILTDEETTNNYLKHLNRTKHTWNNDEPPKAPHGSTGGYVLSDSPKAIYARARRKEKRGWVNETE